MGDPRRRPVDLGPMDMTKLTFETSVSPWWPGLSHGRVANRRVAPAL
jgi:hypothetical protein